MATTITILAESVQGSLPTPSLSGSLPGGVARDFLVNIVSSDWKTIGAGVHELDILVERSLDAGVSWHPMAGAHAVSGAVKGGGLPAFAVSWDGQASLVRLAHVLTTVSGVARYTYDWSIGSTATVVDHGGSDPTFAWGLSVTV